MPIILLPTLNFQGLDDAVETISSGIFMLRGHRDTVDGLLTGSLVDVAARLDSQSTALLSLLMPIKARIISQGIITGTVRGTLYQAEVQQIKLHPLDDTKVREFLGREVYKFERQEETNKVTFKVKE